MKAVAKPKPPLVMWGSTAQASRQEFTDWDMTDVLIYWRDYKQNWIRQFAGERAYYWHSNAKLLGEVEPGDHLWLVTSVANVAHEVKQAGFLVAIWTVKEAGILTGTASLHPDRRVMTGTASLHADGDSHAARQIGRQQAAFGANCLEFVRIASHGYQPKRASVRFLHCGPAQTTGG